jgi:hypothetical protein
MCYSCREIQTGIFWNDMPEVAKEWAKRVTLFEKFIGLTDSPNTAPPIMSLPGFMDSLQLTVRGATRLMRPAQLFPCFWASGGTSGTTLVCVID